MTTRFFIILALISFVFSACRKDEIIVDETVTIIPPSEVIGVAQLTGIINDRADEAIPNASIYLLTDNEVIAETATDDQGFFQFNDVFTGNDYELFVDNPAYGTTLIPLNNWQGGDEQEEIILVDTDDFPFPNQGNTLNPLEEEAFKLSGILSNSEEELSHTLVYAVGDDFSWSSYTLTDEMGQFQLPIRANSGLLLFIENTCEGHNLEMFGPYTSDFNIGTVIVENEISYSTISGNVIDCDGNTIQNGTVTILTEYEQYETEILDGSYELNLQVCGAEEIQIFAFSPTSPFPYFSIEIEISEEIEHDIELCEENQDVYFDLILDGKAIEMEPHIGSFQFNWIEVFPFTSEPTEEGVCFTLINEAADVYEAVKFSIHYNSAIYEQVSELNVDITSEPFDEFIEGHIGGVVMDYITSEMVNVDLSFKVWRIN